jgi:hypothetical protein
MSNPFEEYGRSGTIKYTDVHGETSYVKVKSPKKVTRSVKSTRQKVAKSKVPKAKKTKPVRYKFTRKSNVSKLLKRLF